MFSLSIKVLELFLRCPILVSVFKQKLWYGLTRWLACTWYLDVLSTRLVVVLTWGKIASSCRVVRAVCSRLQLCCSSAAALLGQLLTQQGGQFSFEYCPLSQRSAVDPSPALLWVLDCCSTPSFSIYVSPDFCWVWVAPLGGSLVSPFFSLHLIFLWLIDLVFQTFFSQMSFLGLVLALPYSDNKPHPNSQSEDPMSDIL
jgi:hypothetical protein